MSLKDNYLKLIKNFGGHQYLIKKGVSKNIIDSIMKNCDIGITKAFEVSKALNITMEELLTGEGPNITNPTYSQEEYILIDKLIKILRGSNIYNKKAIIENIEAFYKTCDINLPAEETSHLKKKQVS